MKDKFFSSSVFGCMDVVKHPATFCPSFASWRGFLSRVFLHSLYLTTNDTWCLLTFFNVMKDKIKLNKTEHSFEFNPNRSFDERCDIIRCTPITSDMSYEERLAQLKRRFGL